MEGVVNVLIGFLLRLGIPLAVSALILLILYALDKRWQRQALALPVVPTGKPCWEVKGCSEEQKANCPAAAQPKVPCWHVFRTKDGVMKEACLDCNVFRRAPFPAKA
jgi:hypothetical protein